MKKRCIIVGSGLAGSILARVLSDHMEIIVLEVGPKASTRFPKIIYVNREFGHVPTCCYGAGGTTNLWHNGLIPIQPHDIANQTFREVLEDANVHLDEAASMLHFQSRNYSGEALELKREVLEISVQIGNFTNGIDCLLYPKRYAPLTIGPSARAYYDVSQIDFILSGNATTAVRFKSGNETHEEACDLAVVSAGGLGSPGIVQRISSQIGRTNCDAGTGFIDHPMGFVGKVRFSSRIAKLASRFSTLDKGEYLSRNIIRLKSKCGNFSAGAFFRPSVTMQNRLSMHKYKSLLGISRGSARMLAAMSPKILHPDILYEVATHLSGLQIPTRTFAVMFIGEQKRMNNRVSYRGGVTTVDWTISNREIEAYSDMISKLAEMLADSAEELNFQRHPNENWFWSAAHHSGTISLGDEPNNVIDRDLRIHGTKNMFVCDASVIQEHSYANTGLTICQLALRLSAYIRREFTS